MLFSRSGPRHRKSVTCGAGLAVAVVSVFAACCAQADDQQILAADVDRIVRQRAVIEAAVQERYGASLSGGADDLPLIQRVVNDRLFRAEQTYELQCLGIVLGDVFVAREPGLSWVTVQDRYGADPALRYKTTSILVFPLTMISKRIEEGRDLDVEYLLEGTLAHLKELEGEGY